MTLMQQYVQDYGVYALRILLNLCYAHDMAKSIEEKQRLQDQIDKRLGEYERAAEEHIKNLALVDIPPT